MKAEFFIHLYTRDINRVIDEVKAFPDEDSLWEALPGTTNAAGNLIQHLIGNLKTYIGNPFGNIAYKRDREAEFSARLFTRAEFLVTLESLIEIISFSLGSLSEEQLNEIYPEVVLAIAPNQTVATVLLHLLAHLSYHLGQINHQRRYFSYNI
jgi:uncharacterized damage-inducible protein DinB